MTLDECLLAFKSGALSASELKHAIDALRKAPARFDLSEGQKGLWFEEQVTTGQGNNVAVHIRLEGEVSADTFRRACEWVLDEHAILKCAIREQDGIPYQQVERNAGLTFEEEDWTGRSTDAAIGYLNEQRRRPFKLEEGGLVRVHFLSLSPTVQVASLVVHHIVFDGSSIALLVNALVGAHEALAQGCRPKSDAKRAQYYDFVQWEKALLESAQGAAHREYWVRQLAGPLGVLELPTDFARVAAPGLQRAAVQRRVSPEASSDIRRWCDEEGFSPATCFMGLFQWLLFRHTHEADVVVGMPSWGRLKKRFEETIGYFANMVAIRSRIHGGLRFPDFARSLQLTMTDALDHAGLPFPEVVRALKASGHPVPVFQVGYAYAGLSMLNRVRIPAPTGRCRYELIEDIQQEIVGRYELALGVREFADFYELRLEYNGALFAPATIDGMLGHLLRLLDSVLLEPMLPLYEHRLLSNEESEQVLRKWNETASPYPQARCVQELFEEQARISPDAVALVQGEHRLNYRELNERSNQLARYLRTQGVGADQVVGLCVERSLERVVGMLGILKAGGAYLPLDPNYPLPRLEFMLRDSGSTVLLADPRTALAVRDLPLTTIQLSDTSLWSSQPTGSLAPGEAQHLAYVMYTSGSTGEPKGVAVTHRNIVRLVKGGGYCELGPQEVLLHAAPPSFDAATFEIWGALLNGAQCVLAGAGVMDLQQLGALLREHQVSTLWLTAGLFHNVVEEDLWLLSPVRQLLAGGDALSGRHVRQVLEGLPQCRLINAYGPTECTTFSACHTVGELSEASQPVPIGRAIGNTRTYVLDEWLEPVPVGVEGELYIGGAGVARGYVNRGGLTAERFVADPYECGERLYRTGDRVRWNARGDLELLGRADEPAPDMSTQLNCVYEAPQGETEQRLAQIWQEVLKVERVGRHDNFFELGGYSLQAVTLMVRMRLAGFAIDISSLYGRGSLATLALSANEGRAVREVPQNRLYDPRTRRSDQYELRI